MNTNGELRDLLVTRRARLTPEAAGIEPVRKLKGFAKVALAPGQGRQVTIELNQRAFSFWSTRLSRWVVEAGDFTVGVGAQWMNDPVGRRPLERELADPAHAPIPNRVASAWRQQTSVS